MQASVVCHTWPWKGLTQWRDPSGCREGSKKIFNSWQLTKYEKRLGFSTHEFFLVHNLLMHFSTSWISGQDFHLKTPLHIELGTVCKRETVAQWVECRSAALRNRSCHWRNNCWLSHLAQCDAQGSQDNWGMSACPSAQAVLQMYCKVFKLPHFLLPHL